MSFNSKSPLKFDSAVWTLATTLAFLLSGIPTITSSQEVPETNRPSSASGSPPVRSLAQTPSTTGTVSANSQAMESFPLSPSPKVLRYCQRILQQLGMEDRRGLPLELWPDGPEQAEKWDQDADGFLSPEELSARIQDYSRHRSLKTLTVPPPPAPEAVNSLEGSPDGIPAQGAAEEREPAAISSIATDGSRENDSLTERETRTQTSGSRDAIFQVAPSRLADGVPSWFLELDKNGDGQLTLSEFAPNPTGQSVREFRQYDRNNDGVITLAEARRGPKSSESPSGRAASPR
jgi:hypothetical protein